MKRTATTIMLLAGLGGCVSPGQDKTTKGKPFGMPYKGVEAPGVVGPAGEPIHLTAAAKTEKKSTFGLPWMSDDKAVSKKADAKKKAETGVVPVSATMPAEDPGVQQAAGFARVIGSGCPTGDCGTGGRIHTPGLLSRLGHGGCADGNCAGGGDPYAYGPMGSGLGTMLGRNGIMPVPGMGPAGAVAYVPPPGGAPMGPVVTNQRSSVKFVAPQGMRATWLGPAGYIEPGLTVPANYNFLQGNVYRLRLSGIPGRPGRVYYPTLEISPATLKTLTYLSHNTVPVAFSDDDFERVNGGSMVVKVIYLPDPAFQDIAAVAGVEELVSTQLEPGADPIVEATRRGTILAVIRLGNIDLENPFSPAMDAPPGGMMGKPVMAAPGMGGPAMGAPMMGAPMMPPAPPGVMPVPVAPPAGNIKAPATLPPVSGPTMPIKK